MEQDAGKDSRKDVSYLSFSRTLMNKAKPVWDRYLTHPFITQMRDGTLPRDKFFHFLIQDTLYLRQYVDLSAYAFLKTRDIKLKRELYQSIGLVNAERTSTHIYYLAKRGITETEALEYPMDKENEDYLNYMLGIAEKGTLAEAIVSFLPCAYSYYTIFSNVLQKAADNGTLENNYYKRFIEDYGTGAYFGVYESERALCDKVCAQLSDKEKDKLVEIFIKGSEYELGFWDMGIK